MKLLYYPETDSLHIELKVEHGTETGEISDGVNVEPNAAGGIVGFDIDYASRHVRVATLETANLPLHTSTVA